MDITQKLDTFFSQYPEKSYKKGVILVQPGSEPAGIFYIEDGIVRSYSISEEGTEITLNVFKSHAFIPMSWAIADIPNKRFFEAMTAVKVRIAPKQKVLDFIRNEPDIIYDLLKRIYIGMEGLWMHVESLTAGSSYRKIASSLVILARRFGNQEKGEYVISLKMNENEIANYAGVSRETASRELQKLKKSNLVDFKSGTITIHDMKQLQGILQE